MGIRLKLLIVEDSADDAEMVLLRLRRAGYTPVFERVQTADTLKAALDREAWDLVVSDYSMPHFNGPGALTLLKQSGQDIPFIVVSGSIGEDVAVEMMKAGAHDYLLKQNLSRLVPVVQREMREAEIRRQQVQARLANQKLQAERDAALARLKEENEDLAALTRITLNAISTLDLEDLLSVLLERVLEVMHADTATILLAKGDELRVRASVGAVNLADSTQVKRVGEGFAGAVAQQLKPVYVEDAMTDPLVTDPLIRERGIRSMLGVPLKRNGTLIGVLHADWLAVRPRRDREVHLLEITAERCAAAIQNSQLFEELRASEERFRQLTETINEVFWMTDPVKQRMIYVSPAYERVWGRTCASLYAAPGDWLDAIHPEDRDRVARSALTDQATGAYDTEYRVARPDGGIRWVHDRAFAVRSPTGEIQRIVGVANDITERKASEEAVRLSEHRFRTIFEAEPECVKLVGPDGALLEMNAAGLAMLEAGSADEVNARSLTRFVRPEHREAFGDLHRRAMGGEAGRLEFEVTGLRGTRRWLETHAAPLRGPDGRVVMMLAVTRDITVRRQAEEAVRASLREKEALLKEVHHRVKNNLQVITSLLRLETARSGEPAARTVLTDMQGRIQSMALLHEALYRSGSFASVDLAVYVKRLATQSFRAQNGRTAAIELDLHLESVSVGIDQAVPCGLLLNELISNCLKHGFPNGRSGRVRIELRRVHDGPQLRLSVSDTGIGLPADFEARRGRSLGMQLLSDLTRQIGGRLEIGPGPGAMFAVVWTAEDAAASTGHLVRPPSPEE